jgi:4-hydroxybenzoate polyprenyltransferase
MKSAHRYGFLSNPGCVVHTDHNFTLNSPLTRFFWWLGFELRVSYGCIRSDLWTTIYPGIAITLAALVHCQVRPSRALALFLVTCLFGWLQFYSVALAEQLHARAEDSLNKPWRPLAAGLVRYSSFRLRRNLVGVLYLMLGTALGAGWWCLAVIAISLLHTQAGLSRLWLTKNILPSLALLAMLGAQWRVIAPLTSEVWRWMIGMFVLLVVIMHLQDLRDLDGDFAAGRRTLPMVLGDRWTRISLAATFLLMPLADYVLMRLSVDSSKAIWACYAVTTLLCWKIAWRVLHRRDRESDHSTWRYWEYWFTAMFISMILCL